MKKLLTIYFLLQFSFGYTQCIEGDCENGTGTRNWEGDIYEGEFKDGELNGQGKIIYKNGTIEEGEFKGGGLNGQGKMTSKDGYIVEGKFIYGVPCVIHKITFKDGAFYEGKFKIKSFNF